MKTSLVLPLLVLGVSLQGADTLPDTKPLTMQGDLSAKMVAGISRFLDRATEHSLRTRKQYWKRDFSSPEAYTRSVAPNRERLKKYIGVVDERQPVKALEYVATTSSSGVAADTELFRVLAVRWPVLDGVEAEGLLIQPKGEIKAHVVALPDADQTPEQLVGLAPGIPLERQYARWLAQSGIQVVIPTLVDRRFEHSGNPRLGLFTNQPHREWIYRQAFEMGRHVIGYEVQRVLAAVDWFENSGSTRPIGVIGYNEGGLIAMYASAVDTRIDAACVSGYFQSRQKLWSEPIYRNVFTLLHEFGDAEIASLIAPRQLIIEYSEVPEIAGTPPGVRGRRSGAAPGSWKTPDFKSVDGEWRRAIK
ncbi:MAG: dienelactone hydrolase family protein, partial [Limisphaerales bacterium]